MITLFDMRSLRYDPQYIFYPAFATIPTLPNLREKGVHLPQNAPGPIKKPSSRISTTRSGCLSVGVLPRRSESLCNPEIPDNQKMVFGKIIVYRYHFTEGVTRMAIIPQPTLFSWEDLEPLGD